MRVFLFLIPALALFAGCSIDTLEHHDRRPDYHHMDRHPSRHEDHHHRHHDYRHSPYGHHDRRYDHH